jgi:hypothetical protein
LLERYWIFPPKLTFLTTFIYFFGGWGGVAKPPFFTGGDISYSHSYFKVILLKKSPYWCTYLHNSTDISENCVICTSSESVVWHK